MIKLSICMMVKNEEKNIRRCLRSLMRLVNESDAEIVIVDTGSSDNTVAIANEYTNRIFFHPWNDNFSEMRNLTIHYAQGEWILIIDADEMLVDPKPIQKFLKEKHSKDVVGAVIFLKNAKNIEGTEFGGELTTPRIFKRSSDIRYEGIVHNLPHVTGKLIEVKAELHHFGYISTDNELMEKKFVRTKALIEKALEESPDNIYLIYQLSVTYDMHKDLEKAYDEVKRAYKKIVELNYSIKDYQYIFSGFAKLSLSNGQFDEVIKVCEEGIQINHEYIDLYFFKASAHIKLSEYSNAIEAYRLYLDYLNNYDKLSIRTNPSIQLYTLSLKYEAYCNSSIIAYRINQYEYAYICAKKVVDNLDEASEYFHAVIEIYVNLLILRSDNIEFEQFYQNIQQEEVRILIINKICSKYIFEDNVLALFRLYNYDCVEYDSFDFLMEVIQSTEINTLRINLTSCYILALSLSKCDIETFEAVENNIYPETLNLILENFFKDHIPNPMFKAFYNKFSNRFDLIGVHCEILSNCDNVDFLLNYIIAEEVLVKLVSFDKYYYRISLSYLLFNMQLLDYIQNHFSDSSLNDFMIQLTDLKTLLSERIEVSLSILNSNLLIDHSYEKIIRFYMKVLLSLNEHFQEGKIVEEYHNALLSYLNKKYQKDYIDNEMIENFTNNEEAYGIALIRSGYFEEITEPKWLLIACEIFPITVKYLSSILSAIDFSKGNEGDDLEYLLEKEILKLYDNGNVDDAMHVLSQGLELRPKSSILNSLRKKLKNTLN